MLITPENEWGSKFNAHMVIFVAYIIYNIYDYLLLLQNYTVADESCTYMNTKKKTSMENALFYFLRRPTDEHVRQPMCNCNI